MSAADSRAQALRRALVESLKRKGDLVDPQIEAALLAVPRHVFLPEVTLEQAYADEAVPVLREADGTVVSSASQPSMIALMLRQLQLRPGDNVLEIGAGTGYNAAVMQRIVQDRGTVTAVELDKGLAEQAQINLQRAGFGDVNIVHADGAMGYAPRASYDRIVATVAIWDVPSAWIRQLKPDGILVAPLWIEGFQVSAAFTFQPDGTLMSRVNLPCGFVAMRGLDAPPVMRVRVGGSTLILTSNDADRLDGAAVHMLLSEDHEVSHLGISLEAGEYWRGFLPYLMLGVPKNTLFALYSVGDNQQAYGLEGFGFALIAPGSAVFVPYDGRGTCHSFASADALMAVSDMLQTWDAARPPGAARLRLRLLEKGQSAELGLSPDAEKRGKIYARPYHDVYAWLDALDAR